ncbi:unnamed protein product [Vitrella brassicaformis CCMP3155]|uniref:Uncharacterized protein n=1 Tax=Vitrella brassicaformis (strain CCMP3155) TaxID=1169540 RepID=A0A0G4H7W6_VITBC|nr:unnamed protein product [Vitrella brassicaformis CCMP3155]|eukprot:CEM40005.1 unnamed protein product [Vitrella brassicaformis CCMP3155]
MTVRPRRHHQPQQQQPVVVRVSVGTTSLLPVGLARRRSTAQKEKEEEEQQFCRWFPRQRPTGRPLRQPGGTTSRSGPAVAARRRSRPASSHSLPVPCSHNDSSSCDKAFHQCDWRHSRRGARRWLHGCLHFILLGGMFLHFGAEPPYPSRLDAPRVISAASSACHFHNQGEGGRRGQGLPTKKDFESVIGFLQENKPMSDKGVRQPPL